MMLPFSVVGLSKPGGYTVTDDWISPLSADAVAVNPHVKHVYQERLDDFAGISTATPAGPGQKVRVNWKDPMAPNVEHLRSTDNSITKSWFARLWVC